MKELDFEELVKSNALISVGGYYIGGFDEDTNRPKLGPSAGPGLWPFNPNLGDMWHHVATGNGYIYIQVNQHLRAWVRISSFIERGLDVA